MTETNFKELVIALSTVSSTSTDLNSITLQLQQENVTFSPTFISESYQSLLNLENWAWKMLSQNNKQYANDSNYVQLFHSLALFNKNLIFNCDSIDVTQKASLLFPESTKLTQEILEQIKNTTDENHVYITIVGLWFDNLSYFLHDNPEFDTSTVIIDIANYFANQFLMTNEYKLYLIQFQQFEKFQYNFTMKQLFYLKTCSFFLSSYFSAKAQDNFCYTSDQMFEYIGENYLHIIQNYTQHMDTWNDHVLACCSHLIGLICACCWWNGEKKSEMKKLFTTEQIACDHAEALIRIISYKPLYQRIIVQRANDETILMDTTLFLFNIIAQTQNINWFFRSIIQLADILLVVAETTVCDKIGLLAYGILSEILTDEQMKDLKIIDSIRGFFLDTLEQGWHHPSKKYKQIPVVYLLRGNSAHMKLFLYKKYVLCTFQGFLPLSKNDTIQQKTACSDKILIFTKMCDEYPIVYDIIWALSFNQEIQQQLRSNTSFMTKLAHLPKHCDSEQMLKIRQGILWNLELKHEDRTTVENDEDKLFDIMISYSHKDEIICRQIYDELIKTGYRVWIDFDQMHGNVMDAMAQAIEQSNAILICMSEQYRRSNYCRAEAHYAFQRQLKIIPVLVQKYYHPDNWLLFLVGQLLYVDFTKYEFIRATEMLVKEIEATMIDKIKKINIQLRQDNDVILPITSIPPSDFVIELNLPENILDWNQINVQDWLRKHKFVQMCQLLSNFDGRSLVYFDDILKNGNTQEIISLLKGDALRLTNSTISLTELCRLQSLIYQQRNLVNNTVPTNQ